MRTTLTLEDEIAKDLKALAYRSGKSFKTVVNEMLHAGLRTRRNSPKTKAYRVKPVSLGRVLAGVNLDKALHLADEIENQELARKLQMRK